MSVDLPDLSSPAPAPAAPVPSPAPDRSWSARRTRLLAPLVAAGGVLAATGYVALVDPDHPGHYPLCPFKAITGWDCPGCGGLRAVHDLAHGNLAAAVDQNALVVLLVLPIAVVMWLRWMWRAWTGNPRPAPRVPASRAGRLWTRWSPYAGLVLMVVFTVVRNLPFGHYLHSGLS